MELKKTNYSEIKDEFLISTKINSKNAIKNTALYGLAIIVFTLIYQVIKGELTSNSIMYTIIIIFGFCGLILLYFSLSSKKAIIGVHKKGLWINESQEIKIGLIEWAWIKNIKISENLEVIYITLYDIDSFIKTNIPLHHRPGAKMLLVSKNNNHESSLKISMCEFNPIFNEAMNCISENRFTDIFIIE